MNNVKSMAEDGIDAYIPEAKHGMPDKKTGVPKPEFHESRFIYNREKDIFMCPEKKEMHYLRNQKTVKGLKYRIYATAEYIKVDFILCAIEFIDKLFCNVFPSASI